MSGTESVCECGHPESAHLLSGVRCIRTVVRRRVMGDDVRRCSCSGYVSKETVAAFDAEFVPTCDTEGA